MEMSEQEGMDRLLSQSLSAPVPTLSPDFDRRVMKRVRPRRLSWPGVLTLALYATFALASSIVAMRLTGIGWATIAASIVVPVIVVAALFRDRTRRSRAWSPRSSGSSRA